MIRFFTTPGDNRNMAAVLMACTAFAATSLGACSSPSTGQSSASFCELARTHNTAYETEDPGEQEAATAIGQLADAAPAEIRSDMKTIAELVEGVASGSSNLPDAGEATTRVAEYLLEVCGIVPRE